MERNDNREDSKDGSDGGELRSVEKAYLRFSIEDDVLVVKDRIGKVHSFPGKGFVSMDITLTFFGLVLDCAYNTPPYALSEVDAGVYVRAPDENGLYWMKFNVN